MVIKLHSYIASGYKLYGCTNACRGLLLRQPHRYSHNMYIHHLVSTKHKFLAMQYSHMSDNG